MTSLLVRSSSNVVQSDGMSQGHGPEFMITSVRPTKSGMNLHGASTGNDVLDGCFSNTIVMVSTNSTKGATLSF
jgi:hypothetical protein